MCEQWRTNVATADRGFHAEALATRSLLAHPYITAKGTLPRSTAHRITRFHSSRHCSKRYQYVVRVSYCCCAAVLTNKLYVHSSPVGVSVDVLVKERRGLQPAAVPPRHQSRALLATVRAKKNGKKRKIERKSQLCDLEARKTRRPPWPSMSPQQ